MDQGRTKNVRGSNVNKWKPPILSKQYVSNLFMNAIKLHNEFKIALIFCPEGKLVLLRGRKWHFPTKFG